MAHQLELSAQGDADARHRARYLASYSFDVEFDKQGRFVVPEKIREFGHLESDVLIVGAIDHVDLWSPEAFERNVASAASLFKAEL
jgi:MraZ protein